MGAAALLFRQLRAFLREENTAWREDLSNHDTRFLRNRLRHELIPLIDKIFPQARSALLNLSAEATRSSLQTSSGQSSTLFPSAELETKAMQIEALIPLFALQSLGIAQFGKAQFAEVSRQLKKNPDWVGQIALPRNWQLVRERSSKAKPQNFFERWSVVCPEKPRSV